MEAILKSIMLLKYLQFIIIFCSGLCMALVICTKAKSGKGTNTAKSSGGNNGTNLNAKRSNTTQDDVKFNLNIKNTEQKRDEFDDDEENPLAKIPTKARLPKKDTLSKTSSNSKMDREASYFAPNEKQTGKSCYMSTAMSTTKTTT